MIGGPASSTRVRRPRSLSSLAAQPPLMPEPTTIASYSTAALDRDAAIESAGNHLVMNHVLHHDLRGEVAVDRELLQRGEGILRAALGALHPVEGTQQCALIRGA